MILVTGGTGFVGSTLIKILVEQGQAVVAIKRANSIIPENLKASSLIHWVDADITDYFALSDIFEGITLVYHCAAKISYQKKDAAEMMNVNIEGTKHIVNLCLEHNAKLIYVSSIAALGKNKLGNPVTEIDKWEYEPTMSNYSLSKYKSELEVWRGVIEGLKAIIVNPSVIMGKNSPASGSGAIFNVVNKGISIYPSGTIGIVDVEDVANIMITLAQRDDLVNQRFILNSENISNKDLLSKIATLLGKKVPSISASPFVMKLAWKGAKFLSIFSGSQPSLTEETAKAAMTKLAYDNTKIVDAISYKFKKIDITLQEIANTYNKQINN